MQKKDIMNIKGFCVPRKIILATVIEQKPTNNRILLLMRSAMMPIGIVRIVEPRAFIMTMVPKVDPLKPSEVK
jgi:hypothetical protein